jgi:hypothetical protein
MRTSLASIGLCALGAAALAGCGTTTVRHVTTTITRPAGTSAPSASQATSATTTHGAPPSTTSATTTHGASPSTAGTAAFGRSTLAGKSPRAIILAAADALRAAHGYAMRADLVQDHQRTIIDMAEAGSRRYEASLTTGRSAFALIALPGSAFLRGNRAFWLGQAAPSPTTRARASRLAGHWLRVPASGSHAVTKSLGTLTPPRLARCLTEDHGSLSIAGHEMVGHTRAVVVRDAGNAPGATPSTMAVAASGSPYLLRYVATGATRRGGRIDVCNDGKGDGATGTITLTRFGRAPAIQAPAGAESGTGGTTA